MSCPHCGCRILSKGASSHRSLICSDCGHPMTDHLKISRPQRRWSDLAAVTLVLAISFSAFGMTTMKTALVGDQEGLLAPSLNEESGE